MRKYGQPPCGKRVHAQAGGLVQGAIAAGNRCGDLPPPRLWRLDWISWTFQQSCFTRPAIRCTPSSIEPAFVAYRSETASGGEVLCLSWDDAGGLSSVDRQETPGRRQPWRASLPQKDSRQLMAMLTCSRR